LLLETDSPYLSPPGSGSRRNSPMNLPLIAGQLASLWGLKPDELCEITSHNATALFGLALDVKVT
jgi:TatD DNase family protein